MNKSDSKRATTEPGRYAAVTETGRNSESCTGSVVLEESGRRKQQRVFKYNDGKTL